MNKSKIIIILMIFFSSLLVSGSAAASDGPVLILVHFTNPIRGITKPQLDDILNGKITNFNQIGGENRKIIFYCDEKFYHTFKRLYPELPVTLKEQKNEEKIHENRSLLFFSGIGNTRPWFRALMIDRTFPWGMVEPDYSLIKKGYQYPFKIKGADKWDPEKSVIFIQTGVTAMTRAFIAVMNRISDISYPVKFTKKITSGGDISHTSNEVSFLDPCVYPFPDKMSFCTPKSYFRILTDSGFNLIELTGNHNNDYGTEFSLDTINMILSSGMNYFGGGKNIEDAESIRYIRVKKTVFAFIGFNEVGPPVAWATKDLPGAARLEEAVLKQKISEARKNAEIVCVSLQYTNENDPVPWKSQVKYMHDCADLGADIIVSSSAHRAMGLEFHNGKFISYGLGNFLFDQMQSINHRQGLIARHIIYSGRHIQTELIPYMIYDYCQPRILTGSEAGELFARIFSLSLGNIFLSK